MAIGTDVTYTLRNSAAENKRIPSLPRRRREFRSLWPDDALTPPADVDLQARQSLAWTNWPLFTVGLVQRGYPDDAIRKILGQNMLRVARAVLP